VYRLVSVEARLPEPLQADVAAERLAAVVGAGSRRRRWPLVAAAAGVVVVVVAGALEFAMNGRSTNAASLMRIDAASNRVAATVRDGEIGCGCGANLWAIDGTLWEHGGADGRTLASRELASGKLRRTFRLPVDGASFAIGAGSIWVARNTVVLSGPKAGSDVSVVDRLDELSGRRVARIVLPGDFGQGSIAVGPDAVWALKGDSTLLRIDPATNQVAREATTNVIETGILIPAAGYVWICECLDHKVYRYDPRTKTGKTFHFAQEPWHLIEVDRGKTRTLWLLDGKDATITRLDPRTGKTGAPLGVGGNPTEAVIARGSVWIAAGKVVDRVSLLTGARTTVALPKGTHATGIAVDPATQTVWVDNSITMPEGGT